MFQKHTTRHVLILLAGLVLLGGLVGGIGVLLGKEGTPLFHGARAERQERMERLWLNRSERLWERRERDQANEVGLLSLRDQNLSRAYGVELSIASLSYPRLGISAPIGKPDLRHWSKRDWRALEEQMQFILLYGLVSYPHSPALGESGRIVIAGHSSPPTSRFIGNPFSEILAKLPEARLGDHLEIENRMGRTFQYEVVEMKVIPATHTSILRQDTEGPELILFTCYPVGTTKDRFMVRARLLEAS
jgi:LPXTG-site transpeptidase (sortase) family protein